MGISIPLFLTVISLHALAFLLAVGAEHRRSTAKVVPDEYDELTYCLYGTDASTAYGLSAFVLVLISQTVVSVFTKCLCFGRVMMGGRNSTCCALFFFMFSWITFLGAEACLLAGSARNGYHTKYRGVFGHGVELSCATLRKGVFAAGAALTLLSMIGSILYLWAYAKADTGGWQKHNDINSTEQGLGMTSNDFMANQQYHKGNEFGKM